MNEQALSTFYGHLQEQVPAFQNMELSQFEQNISDPQKLSQFYSNLQKQVPSFQKMKEEDFRKMIGYNEQQTEETTVAPTDVVTPTRRKISPFSGFQESGVSALGEEAVKQQHAEAEAAKDAELHERFKAQRPQQTEPASPLERGPVQNNADFMRRMGITPKQASELPTVGEMKQQMVKMRQEHAKEVHDRRYQNKDGKPKDSFVKDIFENWQVGVGEIALAPYKAVEAAEDFSLGIENKLRGTNFQPGTGTATRFMNNVLGGNYLRSQVEHYRKEGDRYQDNRGIVESALDGDLSTAAGKAVLSTIQSAPNLAVSIYSGKKGLETLGGVFLGTTAALQKYDEIKDNENISNADKALAMFGAFVSECVPEIIGAKRYGKMFNQQSVGTLRKETQKEVMSVWQKFLNSNFMKTSGRAWDWYMKYFGEGTTEAMTDIMNLGIDLALGIKDEITKQDLMSIGDSFIVGQLSDAIPSGVHFYQQEKYSHAVKREIENSPMLMFVAKQQNTTPEEMADIAAKKVYQETVSEKEEKIYNAYVDEVAKHTNTTTNLNVVLADAGLEFSDQTYDIYRQAVEASGKTEEEAEEILAKDSKDMTKEDIAYLETLSQKMKEVATAENVPVNEQPVEAELIEEQQPEPQVLSTGNKPLEFTIRTKVESRESGKTSDIEKDVKVSFRSDGYTVSDDGSIMAEKFTILMNGKAVTGKKKVELMNAINEKLRAENTAADTKDAEEVQNQAEQEAAVAQEQAAQQQVVAEADAAAKAEEQRVNGIYDEMTALVQEGGAESLRKVKSPEKRFIYLMKKYGVEKAVEFARDAIAKAEKESDALVAMESVSEWQELINKYAPEQAKHGSDGQGDNEQLDADNLSMIDSAIEKATEPITEEEAEKFASSIQSAATEEPIVELTPESYAETFPNSMVTTPIGKIKLGESQYEKLVNKKRTKEFGMIKPTLENPDVVLLEYEYSKTGVERPAKLLFIKTFVRNGKSIVNFESVTIRKDGFEISVSSHIISDDSLVDKLTSDGIVFKKEIPAIASDGRLSNDSKNLPDLVPTQAGILSERKGTTKKPNTQEKTEKSEKKVDSVTETPVPEKPAKQKEARKAPGFMDGMKVFDTDVYLVRDAGGHLSLVKADKMPERAVKKQRIYLDAEGKQPFLLWSSAPVASTRGNIKYVDAEGNIQEVSRASVYMEEAVDNQTKKIVPVPAPQRRNVTSFDTILKSKLKVEGEEYTIADFLTAKEVGETKKKGGEGKKVLNGYQRIVQHINERADLTAEQKANALAEVRRQINEWIDSWNSLAKNVLINETGLKDKDLMPGYAMNLSIYRDLRDKYARAGNIEEARKIQAKILEMTFQVSHADETNLTRDNFFNPLYQLTLMVEMAQKAGILKGEEQLTTSLPAALQRIANSELVLPKDIESARSIYAKEKEKKHKTGLLEEEFPEVKNNLPALIRFARPTSEKGKRAQSNKWYDKSLADVYKQMDAALKRIEEEKKGGEELAKFKQLLAQAYVLVTNRDEAAVAKANEAILAELEKHKDDPAFQKAFDDAQKKVTKYINSLEVNKEAVQRATVLQERRDLEAEKAKWTNEKDEANKRDDELQKKGKSRVGRYIIERSANEIANINKKIKELENENPWLAAEQKLAEEVAAIQDMDAQMLEPIQNEKQSKERQQLVEQYEKFVEEHPEAAARVEELRKEKNTGGLDLSVQPEMAVTDENGIPAKTPHTRLILQALSKLFGFARIQPHYAGSQAQAPEVLRHVLERYGISPEMMSVFHGTGADFDKFDLKYVGTGEGAQAYGFGVYVTQNEKTAKEYAKHTAKTKQPYLLKNGKPISKKEADEIKDILGDEWYNGFMETRFYDDTDLHRYLINRLEYHRMRKEARKYDLAYYTDTFRSTIEREIAEEEKQIETISNIISRLPDDIITKDGNEELESFVYNVEIPDDNGSNYLDYDGYISLDERIRIADALVDRGLIAKESITYRDLTSTEIDAGGAVYRTIEDIFRYNHNDITDFTEELLKVLPKETGTKFDAEHFVDEFVASVFNGVAYDRVSDEIRDCISAFTLEVKYEDSYDQQKWDMFSKMMVDWASKEVLDRIDAIQKKRDDSHASDFLRSLGYVGIKVPVMFTSGHRGDKGFNYVIFNEADAKITGREKVEFFKAPNGTILGWAIGNEMWLTDEGMNAETPIHEYTHLWVKSLRNEKPEAWEKIKDLLKKNKHLWDDVVNDPAYANIKNDEDAIASELLSRYSGKNGAKRLEEMAAKIAKQRGLTNEKMVNSLINNMRNALQEFWRVIRDLFMPNSNVTIDEIADLVLKDLFDGKPLNLNTQEMNEIKEQAIKDGTFMKAPNGRDTNLTEHQWLSVRTKPFKQYYGDWQDQNAKRKYYADVQEGEEVDFLLDENLEPLVVFHGSEHAGFDEIIPQENGQPNGRGIFTTPQRFVAGVYAKLTGEDTSEFEAHLGQDEHRGIYSLFANIKNPMVVDCFNEETERPSMWDKIPTGIWKIVGKDIETQYYESFEDAENAYYEQGWGIGFEGTDLEEPEIVPETMTTDEFVSLAREHGYDGVIFKNIIDGTDSDLLNDDVEGGDYMRAHDVIVAMQSNQLKSAVTNNGLYSQENARIEYQYAESELKELDEPAEKLIRRQEDKGTSLQLDPDLSAQERSNWWETVVTRLMDMSNGMRLILNSINAYRKLRGEEPLDMDKYDVRTKFEACRSITANKIGFLERGIQLELDDTLRELAEKVEDSDFYKAHMREVGGEKPTVLSPIQFIERYLMARNNWERAKEGVPRGLAEFKQRMGMGVIEFSNAFTDAYGEQAVLNLWDKIRQMTDFALDTNLEGGMISQELYDELKAKKFYVPQRGFWDDVNPENEENDEKDLLLRRTRGNVTARNKLDSMHKAEGGKSLADGCLAYINRDVRQAIRLSEENKVKKVMFDLLRDNEDWCHEPDHNFKVPRQVFYEDDGEGGIRVMDDGPTEEQKQEMRQLKAIVKQLKEEYRKAETEEDKVDIAAEIEATEAQYPYFDEKDSFRILHSRVSGQYDSKGLRKNRKEKDAKAVVGLYINGVPCEIDMTPRFVYTADALNGRVDKRWILSGLKSVTSWLSAQFTMNNPTFFAVNITRDTPLILTKGAAEYGPEFSMRFTANWAISQKAIWKYLLTGEVENTDIGAQLNDFLMNGGNTGYSNLEELERWRRKVADLNPGGFEALQRELSTVEGAKKAGKVLAAAGRGIAKIGDKTLSWAELRPMAQVLNEWSEIISRFSAYKSVVDMGLGINEGIHAAHNLSTNFNRKGLGAPFINLFNTLTVFANASIQGASGYWRTLDAQGGTGEKAKKIAKTAAYMGMLPAFLGFLCTMFNPDDDEYEYMVSEYERDNYVILGDKRFALNEQLKPWWVIGVNIALGLRGKRTAAQMRNSILTSIMTNWMPLPQNLTGAANMFIENTTGKEEWNLAQIARTAIMPSAMQSMNQWADNKNFLGGKLRYDIGDIPEYEMAPNEAELYKDMAYMFYVWGGGNELVPSKTKADGSGEKLRRWWDVNPKEIKSNTFWIPSGALDNFCLAYGLAKDVKDKIEGDYTGTNVRTKDLPVINRFYKPSEKSLYRYAVVREARDIVKRHDDQVKNYEKQVKHFADIYAQTGSEEALASRDEAIRLLQEEKSDVVAEKTKKILSKYDKRSIRSLQNKLGESNKEIKSLHGDAVESLEGVEKELVQLLLEGVNLKKGLRHSSDVPEWIDWFDDHSPYRNERRK